MLEQKYVELLHATEQVREAIVNDDASTAGNKYETSRAMNQLELERMGTQLRQLEDQLKAIRQIPITVDVSSVGKGNMVRVGSMWVFIALALGRVNLDGMVISVISPVSPLAVAMMHKKPGDLVVIAGKEQHIEDII